MNTKYYVRFFIIFIIVISIIYAIFLGKTGFLKYREIKKEINIERVTVLELEKKILDLESNIKKLKKNTVELEKYARQDLQMGEKDEVVYLVDK